MIRPYLSDIINNHKTQGEWKTQLKMSIKDFVLKPLMRLLPCIQEVII